MSTIANRTISLDEFTKAKNYLSSGVISAGFHPGIWKGAQLIDKDIYIDRKQVIPYEQHQELLKKLWLNPKIGGVGVDRFYAKVSAKFFGITKQAVTTFMNNLESYQLHKRVIRADTVNPIIPGGPGLYFQIDLIDMSKYSWYNNGYNWIFTCIDLFSKKAYAVALKNKEATTITQAVSDWLQTLTTPPRLLQSDRGSEFVNQSLKELLATHNIRQQLSLAHSPESQGSIERFNGTLKRILNSYFTTYQQPIWKDMLAAVVSNYNHSIHSSIGMTPASANQHETTVRKRLQAAAYHKLQASPKYPQLLVGDHVRLSLQTTTDYRKDTFRKKYLTQWSPQIYTVTAIIAATVFSSDKYAVRDAQGQSTGRRYFRYQLQKINPEQLIAVEQHRPSFEPGFFNRVQHLQQMPRGPRGNQQVPSTVVTRAQQAQQQRTNYYNQLIAQHGLQNFTIPLIPVPRNK